MTESSNSPALTAGTNGLRGEFFGMEYRPYEEQTFEEWKEDGLTFLAIGKRFQFFVGDWLRFGENKFGEKAYAFLDKADHTYANWATVCGKVSVSRRRDDVNFSIHAEVAPLPPQEQTLVLTEAAEKNYTVPQARERVRELQQKTAEEEHGPPEVVIKRKCPTCHGEGEIIVEQETEIVEADDFPITVREDDLGGDAA